jgi:hypothetical protein
MMPAAIVGHNPFASFHPGHMHALQNQAFQPGNAGPMNSAFDPWKDSNCVPQALHPSLSVHTGVVTTAGPPDDLSNNTLSVQTAVSKSGNPIHGGFAVRTAVTTNTAPAKGNKTLIVQTAATTNVTQSDVHPDAQQDVRPDVRSGVHPDVHPEQAPDVAVTVSVNKPPKKKARTTPPEVKPAEEEEDLPNFKQMEEENAAILGQDDPSPWKNGVTRFNADRASAAKVLAWTLCMPEPSTTRGSSNTHSSSRGHSAIVP